MPGVSPGYSGPERPALADLDLCTRCGLCEQACPTYRLLGFEPDSPRGRIFLMKQVALGEAEINQHLADHLYRCLGCRACETVCPAGVPFGRLLEYGRFQVEQHRDLAPHSKGWMIFRQLAFRLVLPRRWLFRALMWPSRAIASVPGFAAAFDTLPRGNRLRRLVDMLPRRDKHVEPSASAMPPVTPAIGRRRAVVGLLLGCVMDSLFRHTHEATVRVLARNGCDVRVPTGQWCCGALNVHAGERAIAKDLARANIDAFGRAPLDAIIVNSAGCGAVMKEYGELLKDDSEYAQPALAFAARVKDVTEFLAETSLVSGFAKLPIAVTYQDACHLVHGQGISHQPRALLQAIPGLRYIELRNASQCCGAAGVYSLTHPHLAQAILDEKIEAVLETSADVVATANPGCSMQLQAGLAQRGSRMRVRHVVEILDEAYAARSR
ncbi:MAG: (Fe-S)-binding protein [Candidatus Eremiobacter antarcticus]